MAVVARTEKELCANIDGPLFIRAHVDRSVAIEAQLLLIVLWLRLDALNAQRMAVESFDLATLRFRVNIIRICRIFEYPETVAVINVFPARIGDAARIRRITHPSAVVLEPTVNVIGARIVHAYVIELRRWQVPGTGPARTTITAAPEPAVVPGVNLVCIIRVNPDRVIVAMRIGCGTEAAPAIYAEQQYQINFKNFVFVFGIDNQVSKIKRTPHHILAGIHLFPAFARVV